MELPKKFQLKTGQGIQVKFLPKGLKLILPKGKGAHLVFADSLKFLKSGGAKFIKSLPPNTVLWVAYAKGEPNFKKSGLNRDILHKELAKLKFDGVRLIAINDTWSAMRFKKE